MPRSLIAGAAALLVGTCVLLLAVSQWPHPSGVAPLAPLAPLATPTRPPIASAAVASGGAAPTPAPTIGPIPDGYRVRMPRLAIDLPIAEGDIERDVVVQQTPENFAFHLPGTAIPGMGGNSYLYAHARRGMFLSLWNARVGDEVVITTPDGSKLRYVVSEVHPRVAPEETSWIQPTPDERLTLQTSTGPNREDPRFVVVAIPG